MLFGGSELEETPTQFATRIAAEHGSQNRELNKQIGYFSTPDEGGRLLFEGGGLDFSFMADLGAGEGMLTGAAVEAAVKCRFKQNVHCTLYENQETMIPILRKVMRYTQSWAKKRGVTFRYSIKNVDLMDIFLKEMHSYTLVVSNPPFVRVPADSDLKEQAKNFKCTTNLYGAFMEGALKWTKEGGYLLLITPTSWKNGAYFAKLRTHFLPQVKLERIVSFRRRHNVFKNVQQDIEFTIWCKGKRLTAKSKVKVTLAERLSKVEPYKKFELLHQTLVLDRDEGQILTPDHPEHLELIRSINGKFSQSLSDFRIEIVVGQVVMFREAEGIVNSGRKRKNDLQLVREHHVRPTGLSDRIRRPGLEQWISKKSPHVSLLKNLAICSRRGAKTDRRRLVSCYVSEYYGGIENKVLYLECNEKSSKNLMKGVSAFMNSTFADIQIRCICGGTMVNKGDLERLRLPSREVLVSLGRSMRYNPTNAKKLDCKLQVLLQLKESDFNKWMKHYTPWKQS
jgi:adenine-specific DNA-methyltransferase